MDSKPKNVSFEMLGRIAQRSLPVVERHANEAEAIAMFHAMLPPMVVAYLTMLRNVAALAGTARSLAEVAKVRAAVLHSRIVGWAGVLAGDVAGFVSSDYTDSPGVTDDVLRRSATLAAVARGHEPGGGQPLPYADRLTTELDGLSEETREAHEAAQAAMAQLQAMRRELNASAGSLHRSLVGLRRVLRATLGSSHRDYRKLRLANGRNATDEDEALVGAEPPPEADTEAGVDTDAA